MAASGAPKPNAWSALWGVITRFDRAKLQPSIAARNAVGIGLPLAFGVALGAAPGGLTATVGALNVSFSDGSDPYLLRVERMLTATALTGAAVIIGALCGRDPVLSIAAAVLWAAGAGLLVALDAAAADIGAISLVTLLVFSGQPMEPQHAVFAGMLAAAGGLLQTSLAVALWPVQRYEPERRVLGALYATLARLAAAHPEATAAPPGTAEVTQAQQFLSTLSRTRSIQGERYLSLLNQAERVRLELIALHRTRTRLEREAGPAAALPLRAVLDAAAQILESTAVSLQSGSAAGPPPELLEAVHQAADQLRGAAAALDDARHGVEALAGQLRAIIDLNAYSSLAGRQAFERRESARPWWLRIGGTLVTLRANLDRRSAAFQHAVRLAIAIGAGQALARVLDYERAYWIPMTIAIVLKPDFTQTFSRGILRLAGTFLGLFFATVLFELLTPGPWLDIALITALGFVLRAFGPANYGIFVLAISAMVVLMFAAAGVPPAPVIAERGWDTVLGGLIALVAYAAWPTWERSQVSRTLAALLDAYRSYFRAIRDAYELPGRTPDRARAAARLEARLARSNLEASAERLASEPGVPPEKIARLSAILASSHGLVHACMALEAGLARSRPVPARRAFLAFANDVEVTLHSLAAALRGSQVNPADLPGLRDAHHALLHSGDPATERYALVNVETDRIVNSLNTLAAQLLDWSAD